MNVIELCALLAEQITPSATFVAPQPVMYRQETRNMGQSKFRVPVEEPPPPPSVEHSQGEVLMLGRGKKGDKKGDKERVLELSDSEEEQAAVSAMWCLSHDLACCVHFAVVRWLTARSCHLATNIQTMLASHMMAACPVCAGYEVATHGAQHSIENQHQCRVLHAGSQAGEPHQGPSH
jgi:hypothetical protein